MTENIKYRTYKYNIFSWRSTSTSKVYEIKEGKSAIIPGLKYSLLTLLFGWWTSPLFMVKAAALSLHALQVNFTGGEDCTKMMIEYNSDPKTVFIFNNLSRESLKQIKMEDVDILVELQDEYLLLDAPYDDAENIDHLIRKMTRINVKLGKEGAREFLTAYNNFNKI